MPRLLPAKIFASRRFITWWQLPEELAKIAAEALEKENACLLSHHGVLAVGGSLSAALKLAHEVENLAHMYTLTRQLGEPKLLSEAQMQEVMERFKTYGQQ